MQPERTETQDQRYPLFGLVKGVLGRIGQVSRKAQVGGQVLAISVGLIILAHPLFAQQEPLEIVEAGALKSTGDLVQGEQITLRWRELTFLGKLMEGNTREGVYRFFEGIRLQGTDLQAQGSQLTLNTRTRQWTLQDGSATLQPAYTGNRLLQPLYLQGKHLEGQAPRVQGTHLEATTCDQEHPHFCWHAEAMEAEEGKRAILRRVRLQILGRTVLSLPYVVVPLRETGESSPLPDVGYSELEGWYLRYAVAYLLFRGADGTARFDLMQKRGIGLNLQQEYPGGTASLYFLRDQRQRTDSLTGRLQYSRTFGNLQTRWDADYRRNSYLLFADNTAWDIRTEWVLPSTTGQTRLLAHENRSFSGTYESIGRAFSLQETRTLGKLQANLLGDYQERESRFGDTRSGSRQWNLRTNLRYSIGTATFGLDYDRLLPVGTTPAFFGGLERLPELSLTAPSRWFGLRLPETTFRLSVGSFVEGFQNRLRRERYAFEWQGRIGTERLATPFPLSEAPFQTDTPRPRTTPSARTALTGSYLFRQTFYSDDTAQYVLQNNLEQSVRLAERAQISLRWNYLRPYGYSPLSLDRTGAYNLLSADLRTLLPNGWSLSANTSYDLQARKRGTNAWSLLNLNLDYEPAEWLRWRNQLSYDPNRERLLGWQTDLRWRFGDSQVVFAGRYDALRSKWGRVFVRGDAIKWGRSQFSFILQYNGYLNRFEGRQLLWVYDLHCAELEVRYIENPLGLRRDTGVQVFLRLKAFPRFSRFGYGDLGQPLGGIGSSL